MILHEVQLKLVDISDKEVEDALIKEAKKRGFKRGVEYKTLFDSPNIQLGKFSLEYMPVRNSLLAITAQGIIFENGKWATIIETITKAEAEKQLGKTIKG